MDKKIVQNQTLLLGNMSNLNARPIQRREDLIKLQRPFTMRPFASVVDFINFYENLPITHKQVNDNISYTYKGIQDSTFRDAENIIRNTSGIVSNTSWFGEPTENSVDAYLQRTRYQRMDDYQDIYLRLIKPRLSEILQTSMAKLEQPKILYNDRQLGIFDFNRASLGLIPINKFYSFKYKTFFDAIDVETYSDKGVFKYKLYLDGSPVVLVPSLLTDDEELKEKIYREIYEGADTFETIKKYDVRIGGIDAFTSTFKKVYILKEKVKKLKNAIRIFVNMQTNGNILFDRYKWSGYLAVGVAEILDFLGYAVNIVGIYGTDYRINVQNTLVSGTRFNYINLKRFDETLDKPSLLYFLSDMSWFRLRLFDYSIREAELYDDYFDTGLGHATDIEDIEKAVNEDFGARDKMWNLQGKLENNCQFLYYFMGDVHDEQEMSQLILDIATDAVNRNEEARNLFGG